MEKPVTIICTTLLAETSPQALPLGAACVASAIKHELEHSTSLNKTDVNVQLVSFSAEDKDLLGLDTATAGKVIAKKLAQIKPKIICFSLYVWNRLVLTEVACCLKKMIPALYCIAGGPEVSADPKSFTEVAENPFDYVVTGEGEKSGSALVMSLLDDSQIGIAFQDPIIQGMPCDIETLASPYLDGTLNPTVYGGSLWELARGCPFSCSYCYESKGEKKVRYFPKERLYKELDLFVEQGVTQVFVLDPTYNIDTKRALEVLRHIQKKAPDIFFHFECRPEFIDRQLAQAFADIPCSLQIGLQSADETVLTLVNRSFNKKKFVCNVGFLNDVGAVFGFDLIYGLPGDTITGFKQSIDFALSLYPNHLELFQLAVLPGTDLFDRAEQLKLNYMHKPPYHIQSTPNFSAQDLRSAERLANACSLFYTQGRAVAWFLALLSPLKRKPSAFFADFAQFLDEQNIILSKLCTETTDSTYITKLQKNFVQRQYNKKNLRNLIPFTNDIITLHGAIASFVASGTESQVSLNYHPDDLLSEYAQDALYFVENATNSPCRVEVCQEATQEPDGDVYRLL